MTATLKDIKGWIKTAQEKGATHLIVAHDTYDHDNYPVYVMSDEDVREIENEKYNGQNMQTSDEVYSFTGKHSVAKQLEEDRSRHYD